jgi:hypothetical protein
MCHQIAQKILGSAGVLLTAYGFLLMSGAALFQEGLMGIAAQSLWNVPPLRWWEWLLLKLLWPFFKLIGVIHERDPYYDSKSEVKQREDRWQEMKILIGGGLILLGSVMQAVSYWL